MEKKTVSDLIGQVRNLLQPFWTLTESVSSGTMNIVNWREVAENAEDQKESIIQALEQIVEISQELRYSENDMIAAYWGGIEGPINDYSNAKIIGSHMIDIDSGGGAKKWLTEYNATLKEAKQ